MTPHIATAAALAAALAARAVVCPGQGILRAQLLRGIDGSTLAPALATATAVLGPEFTHSLFHGDDNFLRDTANAQPAIVFATYAIAATKAPEALAQASYICGHSLGEYTALLLNGVLSLELTLRLVRLRAQLMKEATSAATNGTTGMVAIMFRPNFFSQVLGVADELGVVANINAPGQIVLAGATDTLASAIDKISTTTTRVRSKRLPVTIPFHTPLLRGIEPKLTAFLDTVPLGEPLVPMAVNVSGEVVRTSHEMVRAVVRANSRPVQWVKVQQALGNAPRLYLGPGLVLERFNPGTVIDL